MRKNWNGGILLEKVSPDFCFIFSKRKKGEPKEADPSFLFYLKQDEQGRGRIEEEKRESLQCKEKRVCSPPTHPTGPCVYSRPEIGRKSKEKVVCVVEEMRNDLRVAVRNREELRIQ